MKGRDGSATCLAVLFVVIGPVARGELDHFEGIEDECMRRCRPMRLAAPLWLLLIGVAAGREPVVTLSSLIRESTDLVELSRFPSPEFRLVQGSSRGLGGAGQEDVLEADWLDLSRFTPDEPAALFASTGPGALVHVWLAARDGARGWLRVELDGTEVEGLKLAIGNVAPPEADNAVAVWSGASAGTWKLSVPVAYQESCRVVFEPGDEIATGKLAYQVSSRVYGPDVFVETLSQNVLERERDSVVRLLAPPLAEAASGASEGWDVRFPLELSSKKPSAEIQIPRQRGGVVTELRLRPSTDDAEVLRGTILTLSFDGRTTVRVPLGDFFGTGPGTQPFSSRMTSITGEGDFVCRWPMPFVARVQVSLEGPGEPDVELERRKRPGLGGLLNPFRRREEKRRRKQSPTPIVLADEAISVEGAVLVRHYDWDSRSMYFHSDWTTTDGRSAESDDWTGFALSGRGVYAGTVLHVANPTRDWWGEGEERIFLDHEEVSSLAGSGAAEFFGFWFGSNGLHASPLTGRTRMDGPRNFGHQSYYRWRIWDRIPFNTSMRFDWGVPVSGSSTPVVFGVVNYWYSDPSHSVDVARVSEAATRIPPLPERTVPRIAGALEGESLVTLEVDGDAPRVDSMVDYEENGPWSGDRHIVWNGGRPGRNLILGFDAPEAGRYSVQAYFSRSADAGIHRLTINDESTGEPIDLYDSQPTRIGPIDLGVFRLEPVGNRLSVEVVSSSRLASPKNCVFGLDCLVLTPVR